MSSVHNLDRPHCTGLGLRFDSLFLDAADSLRVQLTTPHPLSVRGWFPNVGLTYLPAPKPFYFPTPELSTAIKKPGSLRASAIGDWLSAIGPRPSAIGPRPSAIGDRPSAIGDSPAAPPSLPLFPLLPAEIYHSQFTLPSGHRPSAIPQPPPHPSHYSH